MNTLLAKPYRAMADAIHYVLRSTTAEWFLRNYDDHAANVAAYEVTRALYRVAAEVAIRAQFEPDFHKGAFYMLASGHEHLPENKEVPEFARPFLEVETARRMRYEWGFWGLLCALGLIIGLVIAFWPKSQY